MGSRAKNPNPIYIGDDLVEDIILRLPLKSILKFKIVSKQWRSTLESSRFAERRMSVQKKRKILAVGNRAESRFEGDAEIDMVYLQCNDATRTSLTCDGLVCIPVPGWVKVLNPSTGESLKFPSGDPSDDDAEVDNHERKLWWSAFPGNWTMGFGRDKVNGRYKVVRMLFDDPDHHRCEILDLNIGEWRKLNPLPHKIGTKRKSAFVNGSIYWLNLYGSYKIIALDLHAEEFREVSVPPLRHVVSTQIVNLQDSLAVATATPFEEDLVWKLLIWTMDAQEESWSLTYSIGLSHPLASKKWWSCCFTPMVVSKKGSVYFYDSEKKLFKYCPETGSLLCVSQDIFVVSPFVENLVSLRPEINTSVYRCGPSYIDQVSGSSSMISNMVRNVVSLVIFGFRYRR